MKNKPSSAIYAMQKAKDIMHSRHLLTLFYYLIIYPYLDYGITLRRYTH